jgi:hypothetical protein
MAFVTTSPEIGEAHRNPIMHYPGRPPI